MSDANVSAQARRERQEKERRLAAELAAKLVGELVSAARLAEQHVIFRACMLQRRSGQMQRR